MGFRGALPPERVSAIERAAVADAAAEPVSAGAASAAAEPAPAAQSEPRPEAARGRRRPLPLARVQNHLQAAYACAQASLPYSVFSLQVTLARAQGALLLEGHDSSTFYSEALGFLTRGVMEPILGDARVSPYLGLSVDEKGRYLCAVISYLTPAFEAKTATFAYRELPGFTAQDITKAISDAFAESNLPLGRIASFTADGASVMGTRAALSPGKSNVAAMLQAAASQPLLVAHCAAHRLQLSISSALHSDEYLGKVEHAITRLFRFLRGPSGLGDGHALGLLFWSGVTEEPMLGSLGTAKARWLSLLDPLEKVEKSYVTLLAYLCQLFDTERDRENRKRTQETFLFLASWPFRFTLAGIIDILRECWAAKSKLEKRLTPTLTREVLTSLQAGLEVVGRRAATVAESMRRLSGRRNRAVLADEPEDPPALSLERCLLECGRQRGSKLHASRLAETLQLTH